MFLLSLGRPVEPPQSPGLLCRHTLIHSLYAIGKFSQFGIQSGQLAPFASTFYPAEKSPFYLFTLPVIVFSTIRDYTKKRRETRTVGDMGGQTEKTPGSGVALGGHLIPSFFRDAPCSISFATSTNPHIGHSKNGSNPCPTYPESSPPFAGPLLLFSILP